MFAVRSTTKDCAMPMYSLFFFLWKSGFLSNNGWMIALLGAFSGRAVSLVLVGAFAPWTILYTTENLCTRCGVSRRTFQQTARTPVQVLGLTKGVGAYEAGMRTSRSSLVEFSVSYICLCVCDHSCNLT